MLTIIYAQLHEIYIHIFHAVVHYCNAKLLCMRWALELHISNYAQLKCDRSFNVSISAVFIFFISIYHRFLSNFHFSQTISINKISHKFNSMDYSWKVSNLTRQIHNKSIHKTYLLKVKMHSRILRLFYECFNHFLLTKIHFHGASLYFGYVEKKMSYLSFLLIHFSILKV